MLAMAFVSGLLVGISLLVIQITNIYTKGITLAAVDQSGQLVTREIQNKLNTSSPDSVNSVLTNPLGGRLCTGSASYVWNYGNTINGTGPAFASANKYSGIGGSKDLRFVKVADGTGAVCVAVSGVYPDIDRTKATELLPGIDRNVVLHDFKFTETPIGSTQKLYSVTLVVGTNNNGEFIPSQTKCKLPSAGYDSFCAVNKFDFTARSGNQLEAGNP